MTTATVNPTGDCGANIDKMLTDAYGEGRKDEREAILAAIRASGFDLVSDESGREYLRAVHPEAQT